MSDCYWQKYRSRLPLIEEHPPLDPVLESFDPPKPPHVDIVFGNKPPVPRVWFLDEAKTELVQIQQDRFIHNWRKTGEDAAYPRYERIRNQFREEVGAFSDFLDEKQLGSRDGPPERGFPDIQRRTRLALSSA